mmetsp:Transcript_28490/g.39764  ORF Transcript_28490/g.39764 Transcript_28490/m.39764 type:complete len:90 (-) Transcript_28490:133-402(-)
MLTIRFATTSAFKPGNIHRIGHQNVTPLNILVFTCHGMSNEVATLEFALLSSSLNELFAWIRAALDAQYAERRHAYDLPADDATFTIRP